MGRLTRFLVGPCLLIVALLTSALCFGEPFLVSDPYPKAGDQPTRFCIAVGNLEFSVPPEKLPDGTLRFRFDLSRLPDGEHTLEIKAVNDLNRTESETVPLKLLKKKEEEVTLFAPQREPAKEKIPPSRAIPGLLRP